MTGDLLRAIPAHSAEAERAVLGAVLLDPDVLDLVAVEIEPDDFYFGRHRVIYEGLRALAAESAPLDKLSLVHHLKGRGLLDHAGGPLEVDALTATVPTSANAVYYAKLVAEQARVRAARAACSNASRRLSERIEDADAVLESVEREIFEATQRRNKSDEPESIGDVLHEVFRSIDRAKNGERSGLETGLPDLDHLTNGLPRGELSVLAARPAMGKSSLALNLARHAVYGSRSAPANRRCGFFTLEMPKAEVATNLLCSLAKVDSQQVRRGQISREDEDALISAAEQLATGRLELVDASNLTATDLRAHARRLAAKGGLDLIVVDYLQLMSADRSQRSDRKRHEEVAEISRGLKALAAELKIPVLACAQLNRKSEERTDGRPRLADLRESGAIEQDSALVLLLHREAYYESDPEKREALENKATVIVAKNRYGATGDVELDFEKRWSLFGSQGTLPRQRAQHYPRPAASQARDYATAASGDR